MLGPDHPTTLRAAATLTGALAQLGEAEPARTLGQDTLHRCRQMLGPDHPTTLRAAATLTGALAQLDQVEAARELGQDTLHRCRRVLGLGHLITRSLTEAASGGYPMPSGDSAADRPDRPL
jgi:hypothetical protein